jgi:two-component system sensor histidine kinase KdpD
MSVLSIATGRLRLGLNGIAGALALMAGLGAIMFALRGHLSGATVALVLVVPVVVGVVVGGLWAGAVAVVAGFLLYDLVFIPPYYTLTVGTAHNWVALVVYVVVVSLVARVVNRLQIAEAEATSRETDAQRLLELSELLIEDRPLSDLLPLVVSIVRDAFDSETVVLVLPEGGRLEVAATSGRELTPAELRRVSPEPGVTASLTPSTGAARDDASEAADTETIVLSAPGRPVGLIALVGARLPSHRRALAGVFANHIAIAIERTQLQQQALRLRFLEEMDRMRNALVGAVSHDLRTPLATIKASASALLDPDTSIGPDDETELLGLIDEQADRLERLVTNLLDMSRIEAGSLVVKRQPLDVGEVVDEAIAALRPHVASHRILVQVPESLPSIKADHVLVRQVLVNLLENALRYAPEGTGVEVTARGETGGVEIIVSDHGPGFAGEDLVRIFGLAPPTSGAGGAGVTAVAASARAAATGAGAPTGKSPPASGARTPAGGGVAAKGAGAPAGGTGVGLSIAKAFVEAHGGRIWTETPEGGGARVGFFLPSVAGA